jgi:hypothetical protein
MSDTFGKGGRAKAPLPECNCTVCKWLRGEMRVYTTWDNLKGSTESRTPERKPE